METGREVCGVGLAGRSASWLCMAWKPAGPAPISCRGHAPRNTLRVSLAKGLSTKVFNVVNQPECLQEDSLVGREVCLRCLL